MNRPLITDDDDDDDGREQNSLKYYGTKVKIEIGRMGIQKLLIPCKTTENSVICLEIDKRVICYL